MDIDHRENFQNWSSDIHEVSNILKGGYSS